MIELFSKLRKAIFETDEGVTAIEYALIASLISVFIIVSLSLLGDEVGNTFNTWTEAVRNAISSAGS